MYARSRTCTASKRAKFAPRIGGLDDWWTRLCNTAQAAVSCSVENGRWRGVVNERMRGFPTGKMEPVWILMSLQHQLRYSYTGKEFCWELQVCPEVYLRLRVGTAPRCRFRFVGREKIRDSGFDIGTVHMLGSSPSRDMRPPVLNASDT